MARSDLRGPSADALADLTEKLGPAKGIRAGVARLASRVTGHEDETTGSDLAQVGDDLFAVAGVLRREASVRRMVTDVSTEPQAKSGLVRQLLDGKVGAPALDLVASGTLRPELLVGDAGAEAIATARAAAESSPSYWTRTPT